jgi:hydrogenase nickel incorporation protein HypA/HybF
MSRRAGVRAVHELSICGSIAGIVERHAGGRAVSTIHVRIGQLRQVVPDTLVFCWDLVSADTALAGSRLEVESVKARVRCRSCEAITEIGDLPILVCDGCKGIDTELLSGEEFLVTALDLAEGGTI